MPTRIPQRPRATRRVVRWLIPAAIALTAGGWWLAMPGASHRGPQAPLTTEEAALAKQLRRDVEALAVGIGDRHTFEPKGLRRAADWVAGRFREVGYTPERQAYRVGKVTCENIEATIAGTQSRGDEIIIVGAHYDSTPGSPAANDNASGVAVLLAMAEATAKTRPGRTVRFVGFANEEIGFQTAQMGSLVYAQRSRERGENIVGMIALDTVGAYTDKPDSQAYPMPALGWIFPSTGNFVSFVSNPGSHGWLRQAVGAFRASAAFPSEGAAIPDFVPGAAWSDHWAFWQAGYPALLVTDTAPFRDHTYHTPEDTPDHLNYPALARVTRGLAETVRRLAAE